MWVLHVLLPRNALPKAQPLLCYVMEAIRASMSSVRIPGTCDRVYKSECMFSYDTPESPAGLFTSLTTWQSFGRDYLKGDFERNKNPLYLKQRWYRVKKLSTDSRQDVAENQNDAVNRASVPTKLAIGVEGGFDVDQKPYEIKKINSVIAMPNMNIELSVEDGDLPEIVSTAVDAILKHDDFSRTIDVTAAWEEESRKLSKYANSLVQLSNGKKISPDPSTWRCEESGMTENLWLNLSTGHIGSGRQNWDGSGGTGAALHHYEATGRQFPLAVKLGTITPHSADVYSYAPDEDDMVLDPNLAEHLAHWGIDIQKMEKTDKTMAELQVDFNASYDFSKITESGSDLIPLAGPGYVGLENLGNSCYMNAVVQLVFALDTVRERYISGAERIFASSVTDPSQDLLAMTAKLAVGLLTDRYVHQPKILSLDEYEIIRMSKVSVDENNTRPYEPSSIRPYMFKNIIGKGHPEFSSMRQQDAAEFFQHFLESLSRAERSGLRRIHDVADSHGFLLTPNLFKFVLEDRILCEKSGQVRYTTRSENILLLPVPLEAATNKILVEEYENRKQKKPKMHDSSADVEPVKPNIPFQACIDQMASPERIPDFLSPATGVKGSAQKRTRIRTFPDFLMLQLNKYYIASNWTPQKLDVHVAPPEELNLDYLRGNGVQEDEQLLPEETVSSSDNDIKSVPEVTPDKDIVTQLVAMGFSENGAKRAAVATGNASTDVCMEWVLNHMEDSDFNDPLPDKTAGSSASPGMEMSGESVLMLTSMGFTENQATTALKCTGGSLERAADWLSSHADDLDSAVAVANGAQTRDGPDTAGGNAIPTNLTDGCGRYDLVGFASHIGGNTRCGHYVAHIRKDGNYVLFNDDKIALSQAPPIGYGFLYLYKRR